jgi:hypothetical protein
MSVPSLTQWDFLPPDVDSIDFTQTPSIPYFIFYLWGVWSLFWLGGLIVFLLRLRTDDSNIRMRSPILVILSAFGAEFCFSCTAWEIAVTSPRFPCFLNLYYTFLGLPLYFVPFILRFLRYIVTMSKLMQIEKDPEKHETLRDSDFFLKETNYVSILGLLMAVSLAIANNTQFATLDGWTTSYGCDLKNYTQIMLLILLVVSTLGVGVGLFVLRNLPDPYDLKKELISCFVVWLIALVPYLVLYMKSTAVDFLGLFLFVFIAAGYFSSVIWPIYLSYKCPPAETSGEILSTVEDLLMDPEGFQLIRKVALAHFGTEMCECARAILQYRKIEDEEAMREEAERIWVEFVKPGAPKQCNFSGPLVADLEKRKNKGATSDLFNAGYQELVKLLKTNYFREVQKMTEYSELIKRRQIEQEAKSKRRNALQH